MPHLPLNNDELEYLDTFLMSPRTPDETMDLEMVDGFFVALIVGPEDIVEDEWLPQIFAGQTPEFSDQQEAGVILDLIRRHYQTVQQAFSPKRRNNVGEEPLYLPLILEDENIDEKWRETLGAYWAAGFHLGILAREDLWQAALDEDEEFFDTMTSILALASNEDHDEKLAVLDTTQREERLSELPWLIEDVMFYWLDKRFGQVETVRHDEATKVGRNDPCSCGSGKKFKKCHGA